MSNKDTLDKLNKVSKTFCLAKWMQVTTTLYNGMTHSCHHPGQHNIPVDSLKDNPSALHNTPIKIFAREEMLKGVQTKECDYCWRIENIGKDNLFSDRVFKSTEYWAADNFQKVIDSGLGENIVPSYFEVAFDNTCSLACHYCLPEISSKILNETESMGPYQLKNGVHNDIKHLHQKKAYPIRNHEHNPYIEAFWKWWPELKLNLKVFRITGGEPLLSRHTWKIIDDLIANPNLEMEFAINTNLSVPRELIDRLIAKLPELAKSVKQLTIFTSAEGTGPALEYSRNGLDWNFFKTACEDVCRKMQDIRNAQFIVMATVNILSVTTFVNFLDFILELKKEFNGGRNYKIVASINFLRFPTFSCLTNLDEQLKAKYSQEWKHIATDKFTDIEQHQLLRLVEFMNSQQVNTVEQENFKMFFTEFDKRRKTNFNSTFDGILSV